MTPDEALRFTRLIAGLSIVTLIVGPIVALFVLQSPTTSPINLSGFLAFVVLGFTNVISLVLNAVFWFIRRTPRWLRVVLMIQAGLAVARLIRLL